MTRVGQTDFSLFPVVGHSSSNSKGKVKNLARSRHTAFPSLKPSDTTPNGQITTTMQFATSPVPWIPHAGQKKAVKFLLEHAAGALLASPGTGKSSAVLAAFKILLKKGVAAKMLVVAPLRPVSLVWPREISKWKDFKDLRVAILHGKDKQKALESDADVYVINYEGLPWLLGTTSTSGFGGKRKSVTVNLKRFRSFEFDTLVLDELSRCKHVNTVTWKSLKHVLPTFSRRWGLTGSPASNGLEGLFGQIYCIDTGRTFGQYITHFRNEFFHPHPSGFGWALNKGADTAIYKRIAPVVLRLAAEDYISMPELIENKIMFDLPADVRKVYDQVEDELYAAVEAGKVVAVNAASASSKCRQIVNGGVYLEDELDSDDHRKRWQNLHMEKVELLYDLVQELQSEPILVAYDFHHDLDRLLIRFGKDTPYIGGGVSPVRASAIEQAWNAGEIPVLFGHPQSIGHGLNLQGSGAQVAWHSLTWNLELFDQFIGRVNRQGQKAKRVFVHAIMASKTIDETMWWALHSKTKAQNALFEALKTRRR